MKRPKKASNRAVNLDFLRHRAEYSAKLGFGKQKWVLFCEKMIEAGLTCSLYEARQTVSKYITVRHPDNFSRSFKVRFSNHKPIKHRETAGDCDFFVGYTHLGIQTTDQAVAKTLEFFGLSQKGKRGGTCKRKACNRSPANHEHIYNRGIEDAFYCLTCAIEINNECRRFGDPECFDLASVREPA